MASSLSKSTDATRKIIIGFIIFSILVIVFQGILALFEEENVPEVPIDINRTGYVNSDEIFDQLPRPEIKSLTLESGTKASFSIAGNLKLPDFPPVANVYEIEPLSEKLGDADRARNTAVLLGFNRQETRLENDILIWENPNLTRTLIYDKVNREWDFSVNISRDPISNLDLDEKALELDVGYYETFGASLLSNISLSTEHFVGGRNRVDFVAINTSTTEILNVVDKADADYVRISLFEELESATLKENYNPSRDENPSQTRYSDVITPEYITGVAEFIVQGDGRTPEEDYVSFNLKDYQYNPEFGVYNTITSEAAWDLVQANQGYLIWLKPENADPFSNYSQLSVIEFQANSLLTEIIYISPENRVASNTSTHYLLPYYKFTGFAFIEGGDRADFAFVVPAVSEDNYLAN